ncbi:MAG: ROK family transcriptional regulator [Oscillospiraceae bacterium]|nr:ROK family transcriptional regulator [Oscillospiraceae bacterium]
MSDLNEAISDRRRQTRSNVYHYLYQSPEPRSKQDISRDLNLSLPTVYQNVSELLDAGLIEYAGTTQSAGGRPAMQLRILPGARCAIGISITGHRLRFAATDLSREEIAYKDLPHSLNVEEEGYSDFVAEQLEIFIDENHLDRKRILGVGISLAGSILPEISTVLYAPTLYIRNLSLKALINAIPYSVFPGNDASSGGFAEWFGSEKRESIAFLSLAEGVGGAVLVNGDQYIGNNYRSGEFGHMCVEWDGLPCSCGRKGCLEAYCSAKRLSSDLGISLSDFFKGLEAGNKEYASLWEDFKRHLIIGLHNIRMTFDCDIVLGGYLTEHLKPYLPELQEMLAETDPFDKECHYLRISRYSKDSSMLGVALTFIRDYLNSI